MKFLPILSEAIITEAEKRVDPCTKLGEGQAFCKKLNSILSFGKGGSGSSILKNKAIQVFKELREGDYISMGQKVVLEPGSPMFEERLSKLKKLMYTLWEHSSCPQIVKAIKNDIEIVGSKGLVMIVDDEQQYSLLNRLDTHSTVQAYILTKAALLEQAKNKTLFYKIDTYDNDQIIEDMTEYLSLSDTMTNLDNLITDLLKDTENQKIMMDSLEYSATRGQEVENEGAEALRKAGYEVVDFSGNFGFVDYFGIDLLAIDDDGAYPVQVSSVMKPNPKLFKFYGPDCKCFAMAKSTTGFTKYEPII